MSLVSDFEDSLSDLRQILSDLDRLERAVRPGGNLHNQLSAISIIRSSTYIVAYNAIERAFRSALVEIRGALTQEKISYHDVDRYWRLEALEHCLSDLLRQGAKHDTFYERIDQFFAPENFPPFWNASTEMLPFSGNIDHLRIHNFCKQLGIKLTPPKSAQGGTDLEKIKRNRNNLAHGLEKFSDVGTQVTVRDLRETYKRTRMFMRAVLRELEKYKSKRKYIAKRKKPTASPLAPTTS